MMRFVFLLSCGYVHKRNNYRHRNLGLSAFCFGLESHLPSIEQNCILFAEHYGLHLELIIFLAPFVVGLDVHRTTQTNKWPTWSEL